MYEERHSKDGQFFSLSISHALTHTHTHTQVAKARQLQYGDK